MDRCKWTYAFSTAVKDFTGRLKSAGDLLSNLYAADPPGEFFAVVSETFFADPSSGYSNYPEVSNILSQFYRQHPGQ